jgi:hypothetical protein
MTEGPSEEPPDEPDNGIIVGKGSPHERTFWVPSTSRISDPSDSSENDTDTKPLYVVSESNGDPGAALDDEKITDIELLEGRFRNGIGVAGGEEFFRTHRHWREPVLRLLRPQTQKSFEKQLDKWAARRRGNLSKRQPQRYGPWWYAVSVYGAILSIVLAFVMYANRFQPVGWATLLLVLGVILLSYSILREWYRWRKRGILVRHTEMGLRITYNQPDKLILGFNGDRKGHVKILEGTADLTPLISWPNKLLFWWCGDLDIASKADAADSPLLENIPRLRRLQVFVSRQSPQSLRFS